MRLSWLDVSFPVILAPMAGFTDGPMRMLSRRMGCSMTVTEMISAKALSYHNAHTHALMDTALAERPCAVQLFGREPAVMADAARQIECTRAGEFVAVDINMGCPAKKITGNGEGCALMRELPLASKIIQSVAKAVRLPVTVKFRKGWDDDSVNAVAFGRMAEESGAAAVAVHGRTRAQGYAGQADWDCIGEVKAALHIPVLGNGDITTAADALKMRAYTGCDGVLIGRGALGNPFIFREIQAALRGEGCEPPAIEERVALAMEHARMQFSLYGAHGIVEMRKHIAWYTRGLKGAARLRAETNGVQTLEELEAVLSRLLIS